MNLAHGICVPNMKGVPCTDQKLQADVKKKALVDYRPIDVREAAMSVT